jgi:hypothetical protein
MAELRSSDVLSKVYSMARIIIPKISYKQIKTKINIIIEAKKITGGGGQAISEAKGTLSMPFKIHSITAYTEDGGSIFT